VAGEHVQLGLATYKIMPIDTYVRHIWKVGGIGSVGERRADDVREGLTTISRDVQGIGAVSRIRSVGSIITVELNKVEATQ
jgi:hypothetical protein